MPEQWLVCGVPAVAQLDCMGKTRYATRPFTMRS